jgi:hypothetical protein
MDVFISTGQIDLQECDIVVLGLFEDVRPLKGSSGWLDWRLNGKLSRSLLRKRVTGIWKEMTLIPSQGRIRSPLILCVGFGRVRDYSYLRLREITPVLLEALRKLDVSNIGFSLPEDESFQVEAGKMAEVLLEGIADPLLDPSCGPDQKKWVGGLTLIFDGGSDRHSQISLGVHTAKSILEDRLRIQIHEPFEQ